MDVLMFTPAFDHRFGEGKIASRIGLDAQAITFDLQFDFVSAIEAAKIKIPHLKCVLIDEAQFLTKTQVHQLTEVVDQLDMPVLAYGLRSDFRGEPFEGSQYLLVWADNLVEIKTICHCGKKAIMNMRIDETGKKVMEGQQVHIGGNEAYVSVCRKHFDLPA
jgi:thymidine kinase